jgi:hypothetical protein
MHRSVVYVASSLCWGLVVCAGAESVMAQRVFDNQDPFFRRGNQIVEQEARRLSSDANPQEVIINRPAPLGNIEANGRVPTIGEGATGNQVDSANNKPELVSPDGGNAGR